MKVLVNESTQHIIFTEIRKELPQGGKVEVTDDQAKSKEVENYKHLRMISVMSADELGKREAIKAQPAPAPEPPKEKTPTQPMTPAPVPEPAKPAPAPAPAPSSPADDPKKKK
jgi:hypothetical protein